MCKYHKILQTLIPSPSPLVKNPPGEGSSSFLPEHFSPGKKSIKGFTLLEILIALFIFTLVSIIMVTALHAVFNIQTATEKKAERFTQLQTSLLLFSRDIEQAINRPVINAKNLLDLALNGSTKKLAFTHAGLANPEGLLQRATLARVEYTVENHQFIRKNWEVLDQTSKSLPNIRIVCPDVEDLRFEYLDKKGKFHDTWPSEKSDEILPRAVRISLTLKSWGKITQLFLLPGPNVVKTA